MILIILFLFHYDYNKKTLFVHSKTMDNFFIYYNADSIQY